MRISKIGSLCRSEEDITVVNCENEDGTTLQWIGTRRALYPLHGMPMLDQTALYAVLGVTEKKKDSVVYSERGADEIDIQLGEAGDQDALVYEESYHLLYSGKTYTPVDTSKGIRLINRQFLTPVASKSDDMILFERQTEKGEIYFAVKCGLFTSAIILPALVTKELNKVIEKLAVRSKFAMQCQENDRIRFINLETGEIVGKEEK